MPFILQRGRNMSIRFERIDYGMLLVPCYAPDGPLAHKHDDKTAWIDNLELFANALPPKLHGGLRRRGEA